MMGANTLQLHYLAAGYRYKQSYLVEVFALRNVEHVTKHADLIYDVGLHRGEDAEFYLRKGFRVVAFEADPSLVLVATKRLQNYIKAGSLTIIEGAIVDESFGSVAATVAFYRNVHASVLGTIREDWAYRNNGFGAASCLIEVQTVKFSDAIRAHGIPYYMKVDIEGCDLICINALRQFCQRPDFISIESSKIRFSDLRREIATLERLGYSSFAAIEQSRLSATQTVKYPAREGRYVHHKFDWGASGLFGDELSEGWVSKQRIVCRYSFIFLGYYLLGDSGLLNRLDCIGAKTLRLIVRAVLSRVTGAVVPGWYDTHARHSSHKSHSDKSSLVSGN